MSKAKDSSTYMLKTLMDEREKFARALHRADAQFARALHRADAQFQAERDRRYSEVNIEREKALKIKETADLAALSLAREIQDYKDDKANTLRDRDAAERGDYASKDDLRGAIDKIEAVIKPLVEFVSGLRGQRVAQQDQRVDRGEGRLNNQWLIGIVVGLVAVVVALSSHLRFQ